MAESVYILMYTLVVAIVWDREKLNLNTEKHGVRFSDVEPVLEDPLAIDVGDYESDPTEARRVVIGIIPGWATTSG